MKKTILINLLMLAVATTAYCQNPNVGSQFKAKMDGAKRIVDEVIENPNKNFKSVVTDLLNGGNGYYQALVKNGILKQGDGEVQIKSTIYGIIRIFDSVRQEDKYFRNLRWARNTQIGLGAVMGENNKVKSFASSLTIALVNKRLTNWKIFHQKITDTAINRVASIVKKATDKIEEVLNNPTTTEEERRKMEAKLSELQANFDFDKLKGLLSDEEIKSARDKWDVLIKAYDDIKKKLSGGPLLTYKYEGNYGEKKWTKLNNQIEFLVGLGNRTKSKDSKGNKDSVYKYDFYAGAFYEMNQDTLNKNSSLNRNVFTAKLGVNCVLWKDRTDESSILEAFGGCEYQNISKGMYVGEKENNFKLDLTLSVRLAKNLYLPFQVKYNPSSGRVEGYLDLKFDVVNIFK